MSEQSRVIQETFDHHGDSLGENYRLFVKRIYANAPRIQISAPRLPRAHIPMDSETVRQAVSKARDPVVSE